MERYLPVTSWPDSVPTRAGLTTERGRDPRRYAVRKAPWVGRRVRQPGWVRSCEVRIGRDVPVPSERRWAPWTSTDQLSTGSGRTTSSLVARTRTPRGTTSTRWTRPGSSPEVSVPTSGTSTATSSSSTALGCDRWCSATPTLVSSRQSSRPHAEGTNFVRPGPLEVDLAERLLDLLPAADMVKFAKNGSDVTTAAVKLARAFTGRDLVAHLRRPAVLLDRRLVHRDDADGRRDPDGRLGADASVSDTTTSRTSSACSRSTPARSPASSWRRRPRWSPPPASSPAAIELCHAHGALFVLDEMITGFRWDVGGAQAAYGIAPDLSTFGKAIANGFALSALVGRREIMELGGLQTTRDRVFLLSTTHGGETTGLAAGLATLAVYEDEDVIGHLRWAGETLRAGVSAAAQRAGRRRSTSRCSATRPTSSTRRRTTTAARRSRSARCSSRRRFGAACWRRRSS